jgi:hypothetical protein
MSESPFVIFETPLVYPTVHHGGETAEEVTLNALRAAIEARSYGSKTLAELHRQGEQLNRVQASAMNIHNELSHADKLVRGIGSFFGSLWNNVVHGRPAPPRPPEARVEVTVSGGGSPFVIFDTPLEAVFPKGKSKSTKGDADEHLDQLRTVIADLKQHATAISSTLDHQNRQLDSISQSVSEAQLRAEKITDKIVRLM